MPFAINDATRFISPTKTPEYLAAGKPVVSTPIRDVVRHYGRLQGVKIAADAGRVRRRLRARRWRWPATDGDWLAEVDQALSAMSWDTHPGAHGRRWSPRLADAQTATSPVAAVAAA